MEIYSTTVSKFWRKLFFPPVKIFCPGREHFELELFDTENLFFSPPKKREIEILTMRLNPQCCGISLILVNECSVRRKHSQHLMFIPVDGLESRPGINMDTTKNKNQNGKYNPILEEIVSEKIE